MSVDARLVFPALDELVLILRSSISATEPLEALTVCERLLIIVDLHEEDDLNSPVVEQLQIDVPNPQHGRDLLREALRLVRQVP
jgi:hypothetical protein